MRLDGFCVFCVDGLCTTTLKMMHAPMGHSIKVTLLGWALEIERAGKDSNPKTDPNSMHLIGEQLTL